MATAKRPGAAGRSATTGAKSPAKSAEIPVWKQALIWVGLLGTVAACTAGAIVNSGDDSDKVPPPTGQERDDTVAVLARSSAGQGVCYGWELKDYSGYGDPVSVGSNLGDGVAVEDKAACPRWVQVSVRIYYPSESSESDDNAYVDVNGSSDFSAAELLRIANGLGRLGVTEKVFIDDPGWAITRAAVMLPLLAVEAGAVEPAATPAPAATEPSPLPDPGSDLWRDRWGYLLAAAGLLLVTALLVTVGLVQRRRQRRGGGPAQRPGAEPAATRTPERA
ncbi:hypothetical protein GA0074696_0418 [Micromonospora purpureochromogenes]|uniref:Uncharacterized protein n=1 Tax=Micromonospora purpureochromogenes TaxID=47872 RepID=A0A1C4UJL8_9ACTN|nr:hypothetical protein [Micromonospora purpureochromogenes]SCE71821.1 hypothetical protein GA0074696_0418 [Micromonospora purpureochromogenes]